MIPILDVSGEADRYEYKQQCRHRFNFDRHDNVWNKGPETEHLEMSHPV